MKLGRLGNKQLQKQGSENREQTYDQKTHKLLWAMKEELMAIRIILAEMADLDVEERDIGDDYDN
jgi:hypothetical protein